jgi:glycosyltransferase involved in cell wall biosynthesis
VIFDERPPKILILGEAAAVHTCRWVRHFRQRGWTVRWLSYPPTPDDLGVETIPQRGLHKAVAIPLNVRHVRRVIDEFQPDVISALFLPDYGWLACMCGRRPLAVSAWGSDVLLSPKKSRWHRRRIEYVLRNADLLFADAEFLGERMRELGAVANKLRIIPLGVDDSWLAAGEDIEMAEQTLTRVVSTRRLESLYNVETLVRTAAHLNSEVHGLYRFMIVGDGSQRPSLERLADQGGVGESVDFAGTISEDEMKTRLKDAAIYVSCSTSDGTSVSLLEAMAAGCVPIVTDLPGNREWIEDGVNGILFSVGDAEALVHAVQSVAKRRSWWPKVRQRNRRIIEERALWRNNMAAVEDALRELAAANQKTR